MMGFEESYGYKKNSEKSKNNKKDELYSTLNKV